MPSDRPRTPVRWLAAAGATLLALAIVPIAPTPASALDASVPRALDYLHACQRSDGGFAEKTDSASSNPLTAWAMVAIAATGEDCNQWMVNGKSPADFLARQPSSWRTTTDYARTLLAVEAADKNPRSFAGVDLVAKIQAGVQDRGADGDQIGPYVNSHVWGMIGLEAAGQPVTSREIGWLIAQQQADGGWGWATGVASDTNDTAAAVQALIGAGQTPTSSSVSNALAYLRSRQLADGGFTYSGSVCDADSTAWVIQALSAAGHPPDQQLKNGHDPVSCLRALQGADGSVAYSAASAANPLLVTVQAIPPLCGKVLLSKPTLTAALLPWQPSVAAEWPAADAVVAWTAGSTIRIDVSDGQGTGVATGGVKVKVDGVSVKPVVSGQTVTVKPSVLAVGRHTVVVSAIDRAGNTAGSSTWRFTVSAATASAPATLTAASAAITATASGAASSGAVASAPLGMAAGSASTATPGAPAIPAAGATRPPSLLTLSAIVAVGGAVLAVALAVAIVILRRRST